MRDGFAEASCTDGLVFRGLAPHSPAADGSVLVVLRYEKVRVRPAGTAEAGVAATVQERTYMGSSLRFICRTAVGVMLTADTPNALPERDIAEGEAVVLDWSAGDVVLLTD